jgi:hypothetical protein
MPVCKPLVRLAKFPVEEYPSIETALSLEHQQGLMGFFAYNVFFLKIHLFDFFLFVFIFFVSEG